MFRCHSETVSVSFEFFMKVVENPQSFHKIHCGSKKCLQYESLFRNNCHVMTFTKWVFEGLACLGHTDIVSSGHLQELLCWKRTVLSSSLQKSVT